jgi:hypothetical protein
MAVNNKPIKQKKPPRPPNAFIIYRRFKQPDIVAKHEGITNNEVSKQVGEMWHREPLEEKSRFQRMADDAKLEHMKKYPEYKYRPRRPHEKRRRTKRPQSLSLPGNGVANNNNNNNNININNNDDDIVDTVIDPSSSSSTTNSSQSPPNNELLIHLQNGHNEIDRRGSVDTVSTIDTCFDYFNESRRGSIISLNDFNDFDYEQSSFLFNNNSSGLLIEEPLTTTSPTSSSQFNNIETNNINNTNTLNFLMEGIVSPDCCTNSDLRQLDFFDFNTFTNANDNNNDCNTNESFDFFGHNFNFLSSQNDSLLVPCDQSVHGDI